MSLMKKTNYISLYAAKIQSVMERAKKYKNRGFDYKLEEDTEVLVIEGKHAGETAELTKITKRGMNSNVGRVKKNGHEFETRLENLVAIGDLEVE
jgi:ribosomal protein S4E